MAWTEAARAAALEMRRRRKANLPWRSNRPKASNRPKSLKVIGPHPLVDDLNRRFPSLGGMQKHLNTISSPLLSKALAAIKMQGNESAMTKTVRSMIQETLAKRR